ncbi:hypothetical protein [uncultured Paraglaciecola sp.]|uniref:hypothetical protein n=1 Tax=uncultured Paraglaciecola sp. TaxID=1765024 RepID=UPI00259A2E13|nr:hypothetical protein [uncultured Paraglaciecola sp.]
MKPDIDLENPRIKHILEEYNAQMCRALSVPQKVESAVLPILHTLKRATKPEQIGSGVIVSLENEYFIFSASHVFDVIGKFNLLVGPSGYERIAALSGERFSTPKGNSGTHRDDPFDASVFHIQGGLTDSLKNVAISINDFDIESKNESNNIYMAAGFRSRKSNTAGNEAKGKRECFPTIEYSDDEYSLLGIDRTNHIALAYEDQVLANGQWQTSPTPTGISGGAVIKISGLNMTPPFTSAPNARQQLSAITIEQRRERDGKPGVLIATRIGLHMALIKHFMPQLPIY